MMKITRQTKFWLRLQNSLFYVLLALVFGLLAYVSQEFRYRADWTYGQRNSLSASTKQLLLALPKPLQVVAYVPDKADLQQQISQVVAKYQRVRADTSLEFVNPDLNPKRAAADGVNFTGQLLLKVGERQELIDADSEQVIASALLRLSRDGERIVVFTDGHGERQPLWTGSNGMSKFVESLTRSGFHIVQHNMLRTQSIPTNARFVVIAAPQSPFLSGEVKLLREYVEHGGNLLWLQDPGDLQGLQSLEDLLDVQIQAGTVVDANEHLRSLLGIQDPAVVPVVDYGRSPITKNLTSQTLFPFATMVTKSADEQANKLGWQREEFLYTLPQSWLETSPLENQAVFDDREGDVAGPISIGVSLTRKLDNKLDTQSGIGALQQASTREQRAAVIGDSDFMLNGFLGLGANLDLATQLFNWLSADDALLNIKTASAPDTTFAMPDTGGLVLAAFFLLVFPALLIALGVWIWWRRQGRQ